MTQRAASRGGLVSCANCKTPFQTGQTILTSVSCGHSFHRDLECVDDLEGYQRFDRVEVFTGGCRLKGCDYDGNLVNNSSEVSPTTLLFRNRPLEELVKAFPTAAKRSPVVPLVEIPQSQKRDANKSNLPPSTSSGKRVRLDTRTHSVESPIRPTVQSTEDKEAQEPTPALDSPHFTRAEETDTDDDEEVIASLIAASQALQQMPNIDQSVLFDTSLNHEAGMAASIGPVGVFDSGTEESEEEPAPDPYGMPPLSQWKRATRRR